MTLRADAQGKTFAQAILRQVAPVPNDVLEEVRTMAQAESQRGQA